jgi:integrase/recombinase XerD
MRALLPAWQEWMRVTHYSEHTVHVHGLHLGYFLDWCEERGIARPDEITMPILERYQRFMFHYRQRTGKPLTFWSQHGRLVTLRVFFRWLTRSRRVASNPAADLELPSLGPKTLPKHVLTDGGRGRARDGPARRRRSARAAGPRDAVRRCTRRGSAAASSWACASIAWTPARGRVLIRQGKGKKDRMVPIGERRARLDREGTSRRCGRCSPWSRTTGHCSSSATGQAFTANAVSQAMRRYVLRGEHRQGRARVTCSATRRRR